MNPKYKKCAAHAAVTSCILCYTVIAAKTNAEVYTAPCMYRL